MARRNVVEERMVTGSILRLVNVLRDVQFPRFRAAEIQMSYPFSLTQAR